MARRRRSGAVPELRRRAAQCRSPAHVRVQDADDRRIRRRCPCAARSRWLGKLKFTGRHKTDRRRHRAGDRAAAALHGQGRARLPRARPLREDAERRRIAAHPARRAARLESARRALRARRADHRPACRATTPRCSTRSKRCKAQGQLARHRRARRGHHAARRHDHRSRPGAGRARRRGRGAGHARGDPERRRAPRPADACASRCSIRRAASAGRSTT